jgi:tetraacyldisaccharide 4'-kinase
VVAVTPDRSASDTGDEPLLICLRTGAPVVVGADRAAAARALCAGHPDVDIIVADDGLQHHRLHHDMAVLVFDERGAGNGLCLPAGPLRQRLPAQVPAHSLVLYNALAASTRLPGFTGQRRLVGVLPLEAWWAGQDVPVDGGWTALQGRPLLAAAGLARISLAESGMLPEKKPRERGGPKTAAPAAAQVQAEAAPAPKKRTSPVQFFREVRAEARKITWTTRKETWITSVMVLIMVVITAIFFMIADWGLGTAVAQILKFATPG